MPEQEMKPIQVKVTESTYKTLSSAKDRELARQGITANRKKIQEGPILTDAMNAILDDSHEPTIGAELVEIIRNRLAG